MDISQLINDVRYKVYSGIVEAPDGKRYSLRFLLTVEEFETLGKLGLLPWDTDEIVAIIQDDDEEELQA